MAVYAIIDKLNPVVVPDSVLEKMFVQVLSNAWSVYQDIAILSDHDRVNTVPENIIVPLLGSSNVTEGASLSIHVTVPVAYPVFPAMSVNSNTNDPFHVKV